MTTDSSGKVVQLVDYYPYGETRMETAGSGFENDYLYTWKESDEEDELYY